MKCPCERFWSASMKTSCFDFCDRKPKLDTKTLYWCMFCGYKEQCSCQWQAGGIWSGSGGRYADLGAERQRDWVQEYIYRLINERFEGKSWRRKR